MRRQRGFNFIELLLVVIVAAVLLGIAVASYSHFIERARIARAVGEVGEIFISVQRFDLNARRFPTDLAEIGLDGLLDPWGNPYQYLSFDGLEGNGPKRKNKSMVPVNMDYDIYSNGPDGLSETPFTSIPGRDDIVMAGDGAYFGTVEGFE